MVKEALQRKDYGTITDLAVKNRRVFRSLISLAYNKEDVVSWRAIEAMGKAAGAVAGENPSLVRDVVQRLIWSMSEESGGIGWSAPEMLGEIVRSSPAVFADIPPIILSFHEEEMFLKGVLWAMGRIADAGISPPQGAAELARRCLGSEDPVARAFALIAISKMDLNREDGAVCALTRDNATVRIYDDGELQELTVGEIARRAVRAD